VVQIVVMAMYSLLWMAVLVVGAPYWLARMATTGRYRAGLGQRLGRVPAELRAAIAGRQVVWVHAVSVGEVLAATRLVAELEGALGAGWVIVVSTTTSTGQALARERFGAGRVFYYPLDFAWAVRAYLRALQPKMLVLMESELWPRMLVECGRAGVPVAVVNARVSDRSYARGVRVRAIWGRVLRRVDLFLAQSEEDARRLVGMGARAEAVRAVGNLKYDVRAPKASRVAELIREAAAGRPIVVAGSTVEGEDELIVTAFYNVWGAMPRSLLVIAPRHPERFEKVKELADDFGAVTAIELLQGDARAILRQTVTSEGGGVTYESKTLVVVLNTIGDLASTYGIADVALVGGSLVKRGGHNPLEPAQFGVPVIMGSSYENFRDVVSKMIAAKAICIVGKDQDFYSAPRGKDSDGMEAAERIGAMRDGTGDSSSRLCRELERALIGLLKDPEKARAMGERGRRVFEEQQGATGRAVEALVALSSRGASRTVRSTVKR
jgi:3-deoxy-D-manno-octulosonic-acid transferase